MPMDKQTKQLIALGGLVLVGGIVAYFVYFRDSGAPKTNTPGATNAANTPPVNATPTATPGTKPGTTPGTAKGPGVAPVVVEVDLEIPEKVVIQPIEYTWPFPGGKTFVEFRERGIFAPFDPLLVQNIDVVDPQRREYIETLKQEWILDGIIETKQQLPVFDLSGKALMGESITAPRYVMEFKVKTDANGKPINKDGKPIASPDEIIVEMVPMRDESGNFIYEQAVDPNGQPVFDKDGNPVLAQDILYIRIDIDGKPVPDKDGKQVVDKYNKPLPDGGKPKLDAQGRPIIIRNPTPEDRCRRLIKQVPLMVDELVVDDKGKPVLGDDGKPTYRKVEAKDPKTKEVILVDDTTEQLEVKLVLEATFYDKRRTYKEKDRLTGTRFIIQKIFQKRRYWNENKTEYKVRSGVDLISDTGAPLTIFVTDDERYEVEPSVPGGGGGGGGSPAPRGR